MTTGLFGALVVVCLIGFISAQYSVIGFWDSKSRNTNDLSETCERSPYSKIIVGFINFKDGKAIQFKCGDSGNKHQCVDIAMGIKRCHDLQKQVLLGIGGARSRSQFKSKKEAKNLANNIWSKYFAGQGKPEERPFLGNRFDGINFFMDGTKSKHFDSFLKEFNRLRTKSSLVGVIISISPGCATFERIDGEQWENPYFLDTLSSRDLMEDIDEVNIRFNAKSCFNTATKFERILRKWFTKARTLMVDIYYGIDLPFNALQQSYISSFIKNPDTAINNPRFRGFAVLDVSRDTGYVQSTQLAASENILITTPFTTPQTPVSTPIGPPQTPVPPPVQPTSAPDPGPNPPPPGPNPGPNPEPPTEETTTTTAAPAPAQPQPNNPPPPSTSPGGGSSGPGPVGPTGADSGAGGIPSPSGGIAQPFETSKDLSASIDKSDAEDEQKDEEEKDEIDEEENVLKPQFNEQEDDEKKKNKQDDDDRKRR